jgi:micrococcal nuclease
MRIKNLCAQSSKDAKFFFGLWVRKLMFFSCLLLLVSCQTHPQTASNQVEVKVARVVSGQSLDVLGMTEQPNLLSRVRLLGIDAPDFRQRPWGDESRQVLARLIGNPPKPVTLEFDVQSQDQHNRILAYVWQEGKLLNEEVVKQGYALFVGRSPNHKYDERLERAQQWARLMGKGIWNPENPMLVSPAEFRRRNS